MSDSFLMLTTSVSLVQKSRGTSFRTYQGTKEEELNLPFEPVTLAFQDLHYYVPNPAASGELELLKGIYGVFRPGVLTALMGASGAGKVVLMSSCLYTTCYCHAIANGKKVVHR
jgi:ABC-type multidrug transport system ATPase subunit